MTNGFDEMILNMTDTTPEPEDYTGEDGLLYCGKCHKPKEGYFPKETAAWLGRDRHPAECDCQRAEREEREAAEKQRSHLETVERLKRRGFTDPAMQGWTFENDNGKCPQMEHAHFYVENWETMKERNIGYLLWGGVGTGKSYFAGCIANALMEREIPVCILNFSILRHLVEINCGTPSYAPLVVRQCSGFLFSTFLPDKILNRLFGIQYLTFAQTMLYNPSSSIPLKLMYRFGLEAASA